MRATADSTAMEATRRRVLAFACLLYGDVATDVVLAENAAELHVEGKCRYAAWSTSSEPLFMLRATLRTALRVRRRLALRVLSKFPGSPDDLGSPVQGLDANGSEAQLLGIAQGHLELADGVRFGATIGYRRRIPSAIVHAGGSVVVSVLPNLKVRVETDDDRLVVQGAWRSGRVIWKGEPAPYVPGCALDAIAADIDSAFELFKKGRLDIKRWTSDRRALRELRPPPRDTIRTVAAPE